MKRQKTVSQTKEQGRSPGNNPKEIKISNLPKKEFKKLRVEWRNLWRMSTEKIKERTKHT